jgi:hypothetical protein
MCTARAGSAAALRGFEPRRVRLSQIFTPIEYGCIGYAEEDAIAKWGEDDIEVYHTKYTVRPTTIAA